MTTIAITVVGLTPLLCNRPTDLPVDGNPRQLAEARLYLDHDLRPVIPQINLLRCLLNAGRCLDRDPAELIHALGIRESQILIIADSGWTLDSRTVRDPASGVRRPCHRPRFDAWALRFHLELDDEMLATESAHRLIEFAGQRVGLGDFRPERNGPHGRFAIDRWDDDALAATDRPTPALVSAR